MSNKKIFIIYHNESVLEDLVNKLFEASNEINISDKFTTDNNNVKNGRPYSYYYLPTLEVNKAIKNNYVLYVLTDNYTSIGITSNDFYNDDIFILNYKEYNAIPDLVFNKYDILTIWVDSKEGKYKDIFNDITFVEKRLENVPYEYFLSHEIDEIVDTILNYLNDDNNI